MPFAAALSTAAGTDAALADVCTTLAGHEGATFAVAFFSPHHLRAAGEISAALNERLRPRHLVGCVGESVIGDGREIEDGPALSVWLAAPKRDVRVTPFAMSLEQTADGPSLFGWPDGLSALDAGPAEIPPVPARRAVLLLGDPFSFPTDAFLAQLAESAPGVPVVGGMASGVNGGGQCRLLLDGEVKSAGAVGLLLEGDLGLRSVVSQGCRPVGRHAVVTRAEKNIVQALGGKPPLEFLREMFPSLSPRDQRLLQQGLHVGLVVDEYRSDFQRGDFLIRNVMGIDRSSGAMAVADSVRVGQTLQFQVRDADSAGEDLRSLLQLDLAAHEAKPGGALVFSCNGRGTRLFDAPHHDATAVRNEAGPVPTAGFFAMGELGPVGGRNFVHGYTASVALFEE